MYKLETVLRNYRRAASYYLPLRRIEERINRYPESEYTVFLDHKVLLLETNTKVIIDCIRKDFRGYKSETNISLNKLSFDDIYSLQKKSVSEVKRIGEGPSVYLEFTLPMETYEAEWVLIPPDWC